MRVGPTMEIYLLMVCTIEKIKEFQFLVYISVKKAIMQKFIFEFSKEICILSNFELILVEISGCALLIFFFLTPPPYSWSILTDYLVKVRQGHARHHRYHSHILVPRPETR